VSARVADNATAQPGATAPYVGRFAPSPTGLLHAGSLVAALASWLDARAHGGRWLVRIEDLDRARNVAGASEGILAQLARCGFVPDGPVVLQSTRLALYDAALARLDALGRTYACACSRRELALAAAAAPRRGFAADDGDDRGIASRDVAGARPARAFAIRLRVEETPGNGEAIVAWRDRRLGPQREDVAHTVGDFVLKRADGIHAYQLAVVVDDAAQGVTDVVRGEDLASSTARQILLQRLLGATTPRYLHTPLVRAADGSKLSKQTGARPLALEDPLAALRAAADVLGIEASGTHLARWLDAATASWHARLVARAHDAPA
jgi:glutamyl-Q tRNA(Asp) synthetase